MRSLLLPICLIALASPALAAPARADAPESPICRIGQPECEGYLVCHRDTEICVYDPCDRAQCVRASPADTP